MFGLFGNARDVRNDRGRVNRERKARRLSGVVPVVYAVPYLEPALFNDISPCDLYYHWMRAEYYVLGQLRAGMHPIIVREEAEVHFSFGATAYHRAIVRIITNMLASGRFDGIPTIGEYRALRELGRARFAADLRQRFYGWYDLGRYARDEEIERGMARARALDRRVEQELRDEKDREWKKAEETYKATEAVLRAEIEELQKRAKAPLPAISGGRHTSVSNASTAGPSIYPGRDGIMPAGYYGAQTATNNPRTRHDSHNHEFLHDAGAGRDSHHSARQASHHLRGSLPQRGNNPPPSNAIDSRHGHHEPRHQVHSHSQAGNWLMHGTISTSPSTLARSNNAIRGSSNRRSATTDSHPPSPSHGLSDRLALVRLRGAESEYSSRAGSRSQSQRRPEYEHEHGHEHRRHRSGQADRRALVPYLPHVRDRDSERAGSLRDRYNGRS